MKLLALETATDACSAALFIGGAIRERFELAPQRHTKLLLPMVGALCAEAGITPAELEAIAVSVGPGAFTGVRIAASIAQGLAIAHELPIAPVSTLAALAQGAFRRTGRRCVLATLDARRGEIYVGRYAVPPDCSSVTALAPDALCAPDALDPALPAPDWIATGPGWQAYRDTLEPRCGARAEPGELQHPRALDVATLGLAILQAGGGVAPELLQPVYLRGAI
ncbi:MAG: tRNA (adenosine(37)-N6)-threonylcarbamoyltransferase complex dimerization subunit type 1 TsaB [Gammaproteobacteria bacterium]|nr:tRNA (adenosine(37)-N6)-threonylcarbamoyltransferase complex dimerization subunit type 1 TsaB [Gammaproteobacteria bacterium]